MQIVFVTVKRDTYKPFDLRHPHGGTVGLSRERKNGCWFLELQRTLFTRAFKFALITMPDLIFLLFSAIFLDCVS